MGSLVWELKQVPRHCTLEEALSAFDLLFQKTMALWICESTGRAGLRYEYAATLASAQVFEAFDVVGAHTLSGENLQNIFAEVVEEVTRSFVTIPLTCALCRFLCSCRDDFAGWQELVYISLITVPTYLFGAGFLLVHDEANGNVIWLVVLCVASAGGFVITRFSYRRNVQQHRRRTRVDAETMEELAEALTAMKYRKE